MRNQLLKKTFYLDDIFFYVEMMATMRECQDNKAGI